MALKKFEGKDVEAARIRITGAGDGLSDALDIEPVELHIGAEEFYVLRARVDQVNHVKDKDDPSKLNRVHTMKVVGITTIAPDQAEGLIDDALRKITEHKNLAGLAAAAEAQKKADAEAGVEPLPLDG